MEISLKDLPDKIYVELNKNYKEDLFRKLNKFKLKYLNENLRVSNPTIVKWKKGTKYISLKNLKKILSLLKEDFGRINNEIISYGTKKSKYYVTNPKLPIKDSKELREILIHIMCDGCFNENNGYAAYYNVPKETKKEFIKELKECFGKMDFEIYSDHVHFPTAIPLILKSYFKIDFNSKKCRVPKEFFYGEHKKLSAIIRAAIVDEGTVDGSNVRIDSCNKEFLEDLKNICKKMDYKCGVIWESKGPIFRFNILSKSLKQLKEDLGDLPIEKKQFLINIAEENQRRNWKYKLPGEVKKQILNKLINKPKRNIELILELKYSKTALGNHLRWLINQKIIDKKIERNVTTYFIKDKEKAREFIKNPSNFIKSNKINNYGISQLKLLNLVNNKIIRYNKIRENFGFCKSATLKLVSGLQKKGFIKKADKKGWTITEEGKKILLLRENDARYLLYSNTKLV